MAYPVGVTTRNIVFSGVTDPEDNAPSAYPARAIVACNDILVHIATGVVLYPSPQIRSSGFLLPVTDQPGNIWADGKGNYFSTEDGFHSHSYRVDLEYQPTGSDEWIGYHSIPQLIVPTDPSDLDLDLTFELGVTVYENA